MEYATDGDMFQLVVRRRGLLEKDARWYFQQLIIAVDYCHRMVRSDCKTAKPTATDTKLDGHCWAMHARASLGSNVSLAALRRMGDVAGGG